MRPDIPYTIRQDLVLVEEMVERLERAENEEQFSAVFHEIVLRMQWLVDGYRMMQSRMSEK